MPIFKDGHYKQAAHEAMIQVEQALREKGQYNKSIFGHRLIKFAFGNKATINLEVPLGPDFQEQAKRYFESVFSYYRNFTAHESAKIDDIVCARILIIASELLDLISASSIPFKGIETIDSFVNSKLFKNREEFYQLLECINGACFPDELFDGFFEDLAIKGFSEKQYELMFDLGLVVYKITTLNIEEKNGEYTLYIGLIELTPLGKNVISEYKAK